LKEWLNSTEGRLLGQVDLSQLGLNYQTEDNTANLYSHFLSPWVEIGTKCREPKVFFPPSYSTGPKDKDTGKPTFNLPFSDKEFSRYDLLTLFYIFYNLPKDFFQIHSVNELYKRDWKYHAQHKYWFLKRQEPQQSGLQFFFFNHTEWKICPFPQQGNTQQQQQAQAIWEGCLGQETIRSLVETATVTNNNSNNGNNTGNNTGTGTGTGTETTGNTSGGNANATTTAKTLETATTKTTTSTTKNLGTTAKTTTTAGNGSTGTNNNGNGKRV
jgi:hypothetical protein